jgi:hypothetical protein
MCGSCPSRSRTHPRHVPRRASTWRTSSTSRSQRAASPGSTRCFIRRCLRRSGPSAAPGCPTRSWCPSTRPSSLIPVANSGVLSAISAAGIELSTIRARRPHTGGQGTGALRTTSTWIPRVLARSAYPAGYSATQELKGLQFSPSVDSTLTVSRVVIPFSTANSATWEYDTDADSYMRSNNGRPHVEKVSGEQYSARNVVVLWARTTATGPRGIGGTTLEIALVGSGRAAIFRNGVSIDGSGRRTAVRRRSSRTIRVP